MISPQAGRSIRPPFVPHPHSHSPELNPAAGGLHSRLWTLGLCVALGVLGFGLFRDVAAPWTDNIDANGACWSQSAHNTLRAGLRATAGVPSAFYFGTPPIPPDGYYTHHPPLLSLMLTGMFALFGEKEWVARLLPIAFSLAGLVLLWRLVQRCAGARAAAFCAVLFAAMPMELHYGRMVNFEAIDLAWMLAALECLRRWERTGAARWRWLMLAAVVLALWTAWLGYLFVLALAVHCFVTPGRRHRRLALLLLGLIAASLCLFLLQVSQVQPGAWADMIQTVKVRMARQGDPVPWGAWSVRMRDLLLAHIQPVTWLLGLAGGVLVVRRRKTEAPLRWLGWVALGFFALSTFYVTVFRNASSIHDYASFYFTVPVAMMAGIALDSLLAWGESRGTGMKRALLAGAFALCAAVVITGERKVPALLSQFHILDIDKDEPATLIPELGRAIRTRFPEEEAAVICNFMPSYGPQLHYYAQHELLTAIFTPEEWKDAIADPANVPVDGVIWLGAPEAAELLAALPPGTREDITIAGIPFCFWHPK
jgi:hypothetical protein